MNRKINPSGILNSLSKILKITANSDCNDYTLEAIQKEVERIRKECLKIDEANR